MAFLELFYRLCDLMLPCGGVGRLVRDVVL
jgi:hypothetical protein